MENNKYSYKKTDDFTSSNLFSKYASKSMFLYELLKSEKYLTEYTRQCVRKINTFSFYDHQEYVPK